MKALLGSRQALQACGSELKLRQLNNDRVGSLEWDRVRSILENAQQSNASGAAVPSSQVCVSSCAFLSPSGMAESEAIQSRLKGRAAHAQQ